MGVEDLGHELLIGTDVIGGEDAHENFNAVFVSTLTVTGFQERAGTAENIPLLLSGLRSIIFLMAV